MQELSIDQLLGSPPNPAKMQDSPKKTINRKVNQVTYHQFKDSSLYARSLKNKTYKLWKESRLSRKSWSHMSTSDVSWALDVLPKDVGHEFVLSCGEPNLKNLWLGIPVLSKGVIQKVLGKINQAAWSYRTFCSSTIQLLLSSCFGCTMPKTWKMHFVTFHLMSALEKHPA